MAGNREKDWGKEKKFREGQQEQVLDTLFFDFIELAKKLRPKVVIAENVKGLLLGEAQAYVNKILLDFADAGYKVDYKLLDASKMGVPQRRERVFFYAIRKDLPHEPTDLFGERPFLDLEFDESPILFSEIKSNECDRPLTEHYKEYWDNRERGDSDMSFASERMGRNKNAQFQRKYIYTDKVANTILAQDVCPLYDEPRMRNKMELLLGGSYPTDYNFLNNETHYLVGMSVPPVMTAQIATRVYEQWLK